MAGKFFIRKASIYDIDAMADLLTELFAIEDDFTIDYPKQIRGLHLLLQNPQNVILVAQADEQVVAMVSMQELISTAMGGRVGIIEDLVVNERHRGIGIGSALLYTLMCESQSRGYFRLALGADVRNCPAIAFYLKYGFQETNLSLFHKK